MNRNRQSTRAARGRILVVGGGPVGEALARRLADTDESVLYVDDDGAAVERARADGVEASVVNPHEPTEFDRLSAPDAETAIVAARDDGLGLLVTQLLRSRDADRVVALVDDPRNLDAFADAGVETVCASSALASALTERHRDESTDDDGGAGQGE